MTNFAQRDASRSLSPLAALLLLAACGGETVDPTGGADTFTVRRDTLAITVREKADIQPSQQTTIKNRMEGSSTIISLVPEGTVVKKGDLLVELDASSLAERKAQQAISVARADANVIQAEKDLEIQKKEFETNKLGGENALKIAEINWDKFEGTDNEETGEHEMGEREQQIESAEADVKLAESELKLAQDKYQWSKRLYDKGFITRTELDGDELSYKRNQQSQRVQENRLAILKRYTLVAQELDLKQKIVEARANLTAVIARGEAQLAKARAELESARAEAKLAKERDDNLAEQIQNAKVYAPTPGLVVYAQEDGWRGRSNQVEEGASVRERQRLIQLPDVTRMIAKTKIHEADINKVQPGQRVIVRVDAFQGRQLSGVVSRVSPIADSASRWSAGDLKVYKAEIDIGGENLGMKPGMQGEVEILVSELEDVLFIPVTAVRRSGTTTYVWKLVGDQPQPVPVKLGLSNLSMVQVKEADDGLKEGDVVLMSAPAGIEAPEFESEDQPENAHALTAKSSDFNAPGRSPEPGKRPDDGAVNASPANARRGDGRRGNGRRSSPELEAFKAKLRERLPEVAAKHSASIFGLLQDEDARAKVKADAELGPMYQAMIDKMRAGRRNSGGGRPGGRQPGRGQPGGGRRGERGNRRGGGQ